MYVTQWDWVCHHTATHTRHLADTEGYGLCTLLGLKPFADTIVSTWYHLFYGCHTTLNAPRTHGSSSRPQTTPG